MNTLAQVVSTTATPKAAAVQEQLRIERARKAAAVGLSYETYLQRFCGIAVPRHAR